jgi:hypothetical protein
VRHSTSSFNHPTHAGNGWKSVAATESGCFRCQSAPANHQAAPRRGQQASASRPLEGRTARRQRMAIRHRASGDISPAAASVVRCANVLARQASVHARGLVNSDLWQSSEQRHFTLAFFARGRALGIVVWADAAMHRTSGRFRARPGRLRQARSREALAGVCTGRAEAATETSGVARPVSMRTAAADARPLDGSSSEPPAVSGATGGAHL